MVDGSVCTTYIHYCDYIPYPYHYTYILTYKLLVDDSPVYQLQHCSLQVKLVGVLHSQAGGRTTHILNQPGQAPETNTAVYIPCMNIYK